MGNISDIGPIQIIIYVSDSAFIKDGYSLCTLNITVQSIGAEQNDLEKRTDYT